MAPERYLLVDAVGAWSFRSAADERTPDNAAVSDER